MESVHSSDRVGIFDRQFSVHSQKKRKPIITLLRAGPDYSSKACGSCERQTRPARNLLREGVLVNHNHPPPPLFFKSVDSKGTLSCFRINISGSVDFKDS